MFRRRSSPNPTHGWVISNRILRWLAGLFLFTLLFWALTIATITYAIRRDCDDYYQRDISLFGYWIHIDAGSTKPGCPQP